jgi:hypothetical protein
MHNLVSTVSRRKVGLAASVVLVGGMAGGLLLAPGTAFATGSDGTTTAVTATVSGGNVSVDVEVTPSSVISNTYPTGTVEVTDGIAGSGCFLTLVQDTPAHPGSGTGNCTLSGLPAGNYTLTASYPGDSNFEKSSGTVAITIGSAPAFTSDSPPLSVTPGGNYSYTFVASGNPAPTYSLASGAPGWLSINSSTGALSGTVPWGTSSFTYSVEASNNLGTATAGPFTVNVTRNGGHPGGGYGQLATNLYCTTPVHAGARGTCTLWVTNRGSASDSSVNAEIDLPWQLSADFCGHGWNSGWYNWYCSISGNTATESFGTLWPGQTRSLTVTFTAHSSRYLWGSGSQWVDHVRVVGAAEANQGLHLGWNPWGGGGVVQSFSEAFVNILPHWWW